jgi:hypothetical protein
VAPLRFACRPRFQAAIPNEDRTDDPAGDRLKKLEDSRCKAEAEGVPVEHEGLGGKHASNRPRRAQRRIARLLPSEGRPRREEREQNQGR